MAYCEYRGVIIREVEISADPLTSQIRITTKDLGRSDDGCETLSNEKGELTACSHPDASDRECPVARNRLVQIADRQSN